MNRSSVVVPEQKAKIERIKRKYNNMNMQNDTALKIHKLEVTNNILKIAATGVGIITVIDWMTIDPSPLIDEAVLTGLTTLLSTSAKIVENKIDDLVACDNAELKMEEVTNLSKQIGNVAKAVRNNKTSTQK